MVGMKRLDNLQDCIETVLRDDIPGDCIETGVWRGGSCIFMRAVLKAYGATSGGSLLLIPLPVYRDLIAKSI